MNKAAAILLILGLQWYVFAEEKSFESLNSKASNEVHLSALRGNEIHSILRNDLLNRVKNYRIDGKLIFDTRKDGSFKKNYDESLFNTYSEFFKRDLVALDREPTFSEMDMLVRYRFVQLTLKRALDFQALFHKIFGRNDFEAPLYDYIVFANEIRQTTVEALLNPMYRPSEWPLRTNIKAWNKIYMEEHKGVRPANVTELRAYIDEKLANEAKSDERRSTVTPSGQK